MIKQDDILELEISKLVYEGIGLARYDGKTVFVKGTIDGDKIRARVLKVNKNYLTAKLLEIITPSKHRVKPVCPMANPCGGCDLAFVDYDYLVLSKEKILKEIFNEFEALDIKPMVKSPKCLGYRAKVQYPVSETRNSKRILTGYYKENSHEIVNIKYCPIQPSFVDEIIEFIRQNWSLGCYIEKTNKGLLRHINLRISTTNNDALLLLVLNADKKELDKINSELNLFIESITKKFKNIKGVLINLNSKKTNKITGDETILLKGENAIFQNLGDKKFKIGAESFFQVNPECAKMLFDGALNLIKNKGTLLDLYGGVGTIGIYLKDVSTKITLVEENKEAILFAKENYKLNNVLKYEVFEGKAKDRIKEFIKEKKCFSNVIIDPPRKGSDKETLVSVSKMTDSIIYISCNPMTLKRDAKILIENGFKFKSIQGFDMFPYTHHIECLAHFEKEAK